MRMSLLFMFAVTVAGPVAAQDSRPAAYINAEACLRENAAVAVRVSSGAVDAADFLLTYLCADTVDAAGAYERNTRALENMKAMFAGMAPLVAETSAPSGGEGEEEEATPSMFDADGFEGASVDPVTGELVFADAMSGPFAQTMVRQMGAATDLFADAPPRFLRVLAGQLVLEQSR